MHPTGPKKGNPEIFVTNDVVTHVRGFGRLTGGGLTFLGLALLSLEHLLLGREGLLEELHVELVLPLHLLLLPQAHLVADVALEAEAQRHHGVTDTNGESGRGQSASCVDGKPNRKWHGSYRLAECFVARARLPLKAKIKWLLKAYFLASDQKPLNSLIQAIAKLTSGQKHLHVIVKVPSNC